MHTSHRMFAQTLKAFSILCLFVAAFTGSLAIISTPDVEAAGSATMNLSPSSAAKNPNQTFTMAVVVGVTGNTATGGKTVITYPSNLLSMTYVSSYPTSTYEVTEVPGTLDVEYGNNPVSGTVLTLTFTTKAAGTAPVSIASGSALSDASGNDIALNRGSATVTITNPVVVPPPVTPPATGGTTTTPKTITTPKSNATTSPSTGATQSTTATPESSANPATTEAPSSSTTPESAPVAVKKAVAQKSLFGIKIPTIVLPYTTRNIIINFAVVTLLLTVGSAILSIGFYQIYRFI